MNKTVIVNCKDDGFKKFIVNINDTIIVKTENQPGHTFKKFYQCLGFINYRKYIQINIIRIRRNLMKSFQIISLGTKRAPENWSLIVEYNIMHK